MPPRQTPRPRGRSHRVGNAEVGTGEFAHEWAVILQAEIAALDAPVVVPDPGTEHGRALVRALGAEIEPEPLFRGRPESLYRVQVAAIRSRLQAQGRKDVTPGRLRDGAALSRWNRSSLFPSESAEAA